VSQQQLHRAQVARATVDECCLVRRRESFRKSAGSYCGMLVTVGVRRLAAVG
jgi:hypothetical protein